MADYSNFSNDGYYNKLVLHYGSLTRYNLQICGDSQYPKACETLIELDDRAEQA